MRPIGSILCGVIILGAATAARAEDAPAGGAPAAGTKPTQQFTLPKGKIVIDGFIDVNLSSGFEGDPVSISPDIWYGLNDDVTLGLVHSEVGQFGFVSLPGHSLCLGDACGGVYNDVGLDVRYRLKSPFTLDAMLLFANFADELVVGARVGVGMRFVFNKIIVEAQPSLFLGFAGRDAESDALNIPVTAAYAVNPKIQVGLQTGIYLPFEQAGDNYNIPLSVLGRFRVNPKMSVGLAFSFLALEDSADFRSLTLGVSYAL